MSRIYLYPKTNNKKLASPNPYVNNLEAALAKEHIIVNKKPNEIGVFDLYRYFFVADVFFFNWIEYLPKQKFGKIQTLFFVILIYAAKIFNKKIVWVLHNKYSHTKLAHRDGASKDKRYLFEFMIKKSHLIITHSQAGIDFLQEKFPTYAGKCIYVIHPISSMYLHKQNHTPEYDLLIWGTIHPYKGIIEFLTNASKSGHLNDIKIAILGFCPDKELQNQLNPFLSKGNIIHQNAFMDFDEIASYANKSKFVLFTYNSDTVLSSGSLMDSISMGANIIGPNKGAFKDLSASTGFVRTYDNYDEIFQILHQERINNKSNYQEIIKFCNDNSWDLFYDKIKERFRSLFK